MRPKYLVVHFHFSPLTAFLLTALPSSPYFHLYLTKYYKSLYSSENCAVKCRGRRNSNFVSLLTSKKKRDTAKCLDTAQAVQKKLDFHVVPLLEPDPFHFNGLKKKAWQKCMSLTRCVWRPYEFQLTSHCWGGVRTVSLRGLAFNRVAGSSRKIRNNFNAMRGKYDLELWVKVWIPSGHFNGPMYCKNKDLGEGKCQRIGTALCKDCILLLDANTFGKQQLNKLTHSHSVLKAGEKHHPVVLQCSRYSF